MNSAEWRNYPKPNAPFPMVGECPDCHGMGLRINKGYTPQPRIDYNSVDRIPYPIGRESNFYTECGRCNGYGKCIPPEWLNG